MVHIFGIRHHGPGSAKSLVNALHQLQPDCVLIEAPQDVEKQLGYIAGQDLNPPVALLVYNPKNVQRASYLPFARFSPEWQAAKFAFEQQIPLHAMDLPLSISFGLQEAAKNEFFFPGEPASEDKQLQEIAKDPLGYLASFAGYTDSERWWEMTFEKQAYEMNVFDQITEMMDLLRSTLQRKETKETLLREAFMRKCIRKALKEGFQRIAVVCGAWHSPVLKNYLSFKSAADNALLKGLKKIKTEATWIPWTYERLAFSSGYGAGVLSPAWYRLLFEKEEEVAVRWMIEAARLLRGGNQETSPAHVVEGVRLAEQLAALRGLSIPGIAELEEAILAVYCQGRTAQLALIRRELIIGAVVGTVGSGVPQLPLKKDLEKQIKSARLSKERNSLETVEKKLDLRKGTNLLASHLLHRLRILQIYWGVPMAQSENRTGSFAELWKLKWQVEFEIDIVEAGMWGNTVAEAAVNYGQQQINTAESLVKLLELTEEIVKAELPALMVPLMNKLQTLAALNREVQHLMDALLPMLRIIRYGTAHEMNVEILEDLIAQLIPRICVGLPGLCVQLNEEMAELVQEKIIGVDRGIRLLQVTAYKDQWHRALQQLVLGFGIAEIIKGTAGRILFEEGLWEVEEAGTYMSYALSPGNTPIDAAYWLEGFLHGSGLFLIHHPFLWNILDQWVVGITMDQFQEIVPVLRRTFSKFPAGERQKMMALVERKSKVFAQKELNEEPETDRVAPVLATVKTILGLSESS